MSALVRLLLPVLMANVGVYLTMTVEATSRVVLRPVWRLLLADPVPTLDNCLRKNVCFGQRVQSWHT